VPYGRKWIEREFNFEFATDLFPEIIERLRGTPTRLEEMTGAVPPEVLVRRNGESWSIQENAGHLLDLEPLFTQRLEQYVQGESTLVAADLTNRKTHEAHHNEKPIASILSDFRGERGQLVARLEQMEPASFALSAIHPRLRKPMRLVDMMFFHAEHDDNHLARITELKRLFMRS